MKKYLSPSISVIRIMGKEQLLDNSIKVNSNEKVSNSNDIGFVKEQRTENYNVWGDDWSK